MKSAGTCCPAPGEGTGAASSWSRIMVRTLPTVTRSGLAVAAQSSHSGTRAARSVLCSVPPVSMPPVFHQTRRHAAPPSSGPATRGVRTIEAPDASPSGHRRVAVQRDEHGDRHARTGGAGAAPDPMTGRVLDRRYRIGSRIARGGMASVYEATDLRLDRTVAVKVMHPGLGDDNEFAERFVREARAAARLSHPNVVAVYDQGDDDGTVFLAMELIPGHTLRDVIRKESPMAPARALALIEPVLSALAAAHRAGLIHRDIKPENVLIADDGRVKVADFGLAKAVSAETQHTATGGVLIGTVSYLAPELVVSGRSDARADVYAAGVVLYELLTGTKPHEGESPIQVAYQHVHHDVPPPSRVVPGLPAYVDALVARATARDRELRPADAAVLLHQLHRVSHALAEGVLDDADLTADLTPLRMQVEALEAPSADDTAPEPFDSHQFATMTAPLRTLDRPEPTPPRATPPRAPTAPPPAPRRRSRKGLALL